MVSKCCTHMGFGYQIADLMLYAIRFCTLWGSNVGRLSLYRRFGPRMSYNILKWYKSSDYITKSCVSLVFVWTGINTTSSVLKLMFHFHFCMRVKDSLVVRVLFPVLGGLAIGSHSWHAEIPFILLNLSKFLLTLLKKISFALYLIYR